MGTPLGTGKRLLSLVILGAIFTFLGIIIASNLDFTPKSVATDVSGGYPVVVNQQGEYESPFVAVVDRVTDAIVHISAEHDVRDSYHDDLFWRFFQVPREPMKSYGSGFFFRDDGYILTNNHVVEGASRVVVRTSSGYQYDAQVIGTDPQTDLAVVKIEPKEDIHYIPFGNSNEIKVGDWVIAIGNPFPQQGLDRTVTVGVVSAKGRSNLRFGQGTPRYQDYIQTDASINPGNSGGPLINLKGQAIGVNAAISSPTGASVGIGFAVPINLARAIVPDLIATGKVSRGWLGVYLADVTEKEARDNGLNAVKGVKIEDVFDDSPASDAGIKQNDVLLKFNGQDVLDVDQFSVLVATAPKDTPIPITFVRNGKTEETTASVVDRDTYRQQHASQFTSASDRLTWLGMELMNYSQRIASGIGAEHFPGVYINRVGRGTPAYQAGIMPGSIITQVNNVEIKNLVDLQTVVEQVQNRSKAIPLLLVDPSGSIEYKAIKP